MKLCIGLFGTCGSSNWREPFIIGYIANKIEFFNPQVDDWKPELAAIEAEHLAEDGIILFPITSETYGLGSLSEVGFSILNAIQLDKMREFCVLIEQKLDEKLIENKVLAKESMRARALVYQHLKKLRLPNLYLVDTMDEMRDISLSLYDVMKIKIPLQRFNPHNRTY
jgi:hypothetical protein